MHHLISINYILIVDFDDSFTFNVVSEVYKYNPNLEVVHFRSISIEKIKLIANVYNKVGIILGPGPGHPNEYLSMIEILDFLHKKPDKFTVFGVCLGHQLIGIFFKYKIISSKFKVHGESVTISFLGKDVKVQRYNSLAVKSEKHPRELLSIDNEVWIIKDSGFFSVQFHPESIGTDNSKIFFDYFFNMLGNKF